MISIYVPEVGDGLAAGIYTACGTRAQIDCGSQQSAWRAYENGLRRIDPKVFVLSHFHLDHYNGLLQWHGQDPWRPAIQQVFFPRMPVFAQDRELLQCLAAMARWVVGNTTGSMEADLLGLVSRINSCSFAYQALSRGDTVRVGSSKLDILWPPRTISSGGTLRVVEAAIEAFTIAAEEDGRLGRIYGQVRKGGRVDLYLGEDDSVEGHPEDHRGDQCEPFQPRSVDERECPESVKKANNLLRRAANRLSLAFRQDDRVLFMGDLECSEIAQVVGLLQGQGRSRFTAIMAPHHGTHWHASMAQLSSWYVVSSVGKRLCRNLSGRYRSMCLAHLVTHLSGDIELPLPPPSFWHPHECEWVLAALPRKLLGLRNRLVSIETRWKEAPYAVGTKLLFQQIDELVKQASTVSEVTDDHVVRDAALHLRNDSLCLKARALAYVEAKESGCSVSTECPLCGDLLPDDLNVEID